MLGVESCDLSTSSAVSVLLHGFVDHTNCHCFCSRETAVRIAAALEDELPHDEEYRAFAKWLRESVKHCSVYEESF